MLRAAPAQTHPQLLIVPPPARHHNLETISQRTFVQSVLLLNGDVFPLNETKSNFLIKAGIVFSDLIQADALPPRLKQGVCSCPPWLYIKYIVP